MAIGDTPFSPARDGVRVAVRLTPRAVRSRISEIAADADGAMVIKAAVTAAPENGRANAALVALLAKAWRLPKSAITVSAGKTARRKTLLVTGDTMSLLARLTKWGETFHG